MSYDTFLKYKADADSIEDFYNRYGKPKQYIGRGREYFDCVMESAKEHIAALGFTFITHHDSKSGETTAYYPHQNTGKEIADTFNAVLSTLSVLKHQCVSASERGCLCGNMESLISQMDKAGVTYNMQNALFWAAETYDARVYDVDDMLGEAFLRAAAIVK